MRVLGDNRLLKFVEADRYHQVENYRDSAPLFFELLTGDFRNEALYDRLDDGLLALGLGEKAEALHVFWEGACPDSYLASWSMGSFYISYAWDARGSGWGSTVTEEGWKKFNERLRLAEQHFIHACELDPQDPRAPASLITIARGLGYDSGYMEKWFKQAVEADPKYYGAYKNKLTYLMPKWQGTREEMFAFARECAANPPKGSRVALILMDAHKEMAYRWADSTGKKWREYYQEPGVWEELKPVYERYFQEHPDSISDRNHCAKIAFWAHDYKEAVRQFEVIGKDIDKECWGSEQYFYKCRTDAYAKANGEHRG
jgi:hypothetical protein